MQNRYKKVRAWLTLRLAQLTEGLRTSLTELEGDKHHLADLEEMAADVNVDDVVFEQFRSSGDTIAQIERALERLDAGTYEACEECGSPIGRERLEALPFATQCVACKRHGEGP